LYKGLEHGRVATLGFACDKEPRETLIDLAEDSRLADPWAAGLAGSGPG
jgi:hypothetical protein